MKSLLILLAGLLLSIVCSSCQTTTDAGYVELSKREKDTLIAMARNYIDTPRYINSNESKLIKHTQPEVHIAYDGNKQGKIRISWELPNQNIDFIARGEFLTKKMKWYISTIEKREQLQLNPYSKRYVNSNYDEALQTYRNAVKAEQQEAKKIFDGTQK